MGAKKLWTIQNIVEYTQYGYSWVSKRVAPNTKLTPKFPRVPGTGHPRFDQNTIEAIFKDYTNSYGSLKIEKMGNPNSSRTSLQQKRSFRKL